MDAPVKTPSGCSLKGHHLHRQPWATGWPRTSFCIWTGGVARWSSGCHRYLEGGLRVCERQSIQRGIAIHCDDRGWDKSDFNLTESRVSHTEHGGRRPRNDAIDNPLFPPPCPCLLPSPLPPRQSCFCFWRLKPLKVYILLALVAHTFYEFKGSLIYLVSSRPVRVMS